MKGVLVFSLVCTVAFGGVLALMLLLFARPGWLVSEKDNPIGSSEAYRKIVKSFFFCFMVSLLVFLTSWIAIGIEG